MKVSPVAKQYLSYVLVGIVAGYFSGLFGIGGGFIMVPLLTFLLGFPVKRAAATSLAAIFLTAIAGVIGYALNDGVVWAAAIALSAGSVVGSFIGARLLQVIPQRVMIWIYVVLLTVLAVRLLWSSESTTDTWILSPWWVVGLIAVGFVAGVMAGLLGVGGGIMVVPILIGFFGLTTFDAKGSSLFMQIPAALVGTLTNMRFGMVDLKAGAFIGVVAALVSYAGVVTSAILPSALANILFAAVMAYTAVQFAVRAVRARRS
jgi:uncharacterized membrane protein YfcA